MKTRTKRHTPTKIMTCGKSSLTGEQRTKQGNLVYKPKVSKDSSDSTSISEKRKVRTSQLLKSERTSAIQAGPVPSRFVYYGNRQGQHTQGSSTSMLSTVSDRPMLDIASRPTCKTRTSATLLTERSSDMSTASPPSPPPLHSSTSKAGVAKKRRKTTFNSGTAAKKSRRYTIQSVNYVFMCVSICSW